MSIRHSIRKPGSSGNCKPGSEKSEFPRRKHSPVCEYTTFTEQTLTVRVCRQIFENNFGIDRRGE